MFQFKKQVKDTKEQVLQTEEKLNLHPLIHVSDSLLDYHKKLSLTEVNSLDELQEIQNTFQTVLEENKQLKEKLGSFHETFETVGETSGQFAGVRGVPGKCRNILTRSSAHLKIFRLLYRKSSNVWDRSFQLPIRPICSH